ncbi:HTH-type transcriptional regulator CymR [Rosistilla carotiformis]|uniref:HTH-type transcriptional regulator CymR n=2 Tax=Rosistilla carotiformis TaxID=2528017 RepID=A0A518JPJ7_9BACT|nr:HTH-type transcriptional regulator CymR [Rosistilla carotiformis]
MSAKAHYACLAMLELALRQDEDRPVALREITARHSIPQPFLVQILQQLKQAGYVTSTRGSQGGYRLSVDAATISLLDICDAIGCGESETTLDNADTTPEAQVLDSTWRAASKAFRDVLSAIRLEDLANDCARSEGAMFYI